jgi:hypothetical protein
MKLKLISFPLMLLATLSLNAFAGNIINPSTLTIKSDDVSSLKAKLNVFCDRESLNPLKVSVSCGTFSTDLTVKEDGTVSIPAVAKLKNPYGLNENNYSASIQITNNEKTVASITTHIPVSKTFNFDGATLYLNRVGESQFGVNIAGQDFFGSEASKKERAYLAVIFNVSEAKSQYRLDTFNQSFVWSASNLPGVNDGLKDATAVNTRSVILATFDPNAKLAISMIYTDDLTAIKSPSLRFQNVVELKYSALQELGSVELKPVTK